MPPQTPAGRAPAVPTWTNRAQHNMRALLQACPTKNTPVYGLIDTAVDDSLYAQLMQEPPDSQVTCLFDRDAAIRYRNVAPYLMVLNLHSPLAATWLDLAWRRHWGVWLTSGQPLGQIKAHLKKFLFVKTATSGKAYFRYYDPRVMQQIMPIMDFEQRGSFFGLDHKPMPDAFFTATQQAHQEPILQRYQPSQNRLMRWANVSGFDTDTWPWQ